ARTLDQHAGQEIGEALLPARIVGGAAAEGELDRDRGKSMVLHQPGLDAARADDPVDGHRQRLYRHGRGQRDDPDANKTGHDLAQLEGLGSSRPVTEASSRKTARAAAVTCSGVTAAMRDGQLSTCSMPVPVVSASPITRAPVERLSRA